MSNSPSAPENSSAENHADPKPTKKGSNAVHWGSRLGVVLAVAGSAVGLGNFLRFPGEAAKHGAGAFMIPYFIALLIVGIPLAWAEWAMGRHAGVRGFHSAPGVFAALCRKKSASYLGVLALLIPLMVYTYYVVIEAWCLGYAWFYLTGAMNQCSSAKDFSDFFNRFTASNNDGDAFKFNGTNLVVFVAITFALNFFLIFRGLNKGIETFCKFAVPVMVLCAVAVLIRVLTLGTPEINKETYLGAYTNALESEPDSAERQLWKAKALLNVDQPDKAKEQAKTALQRIDDPVAYLSTIEKLLAEATTDDEKEKLADRIEALEEDVKAQNSDSKPTKELALVRSELQKIVQGEEVEQPNQSVVGGLNFMWNPDFAKLKKPETWLAAAGQIFFSLSVGFGVIINYASYLRRRDDIALSGLTASATNEFFEVCLAGLITLPAAFIFLGTLAGTFGTFSLGFNALPNVFEMMPGGQIIGFLWFFMLFLAAITSSLSMLQPVNSFFDEGLGLGRLGSIALLALISGIGSIFILHYSGGMKALDTIDFWCGTFLIVILATIQAVIYGWVFGTKRGSAELKEGGLIRIPSVVQFLLKFVTPVFLVGILVATVIQKGPDYVESMRSDPVAARSVMFIGGVLLLLIVSIAIANARWSRDGKFDVLEHDK